MSRSISRRGTFEDKPVAYGSSMSGSPLHVWQPASGKADLLIFAGIHGEEPDSTVLLSRALRSASRRSAACAVVLCANPDGMQFGTRGNARGVDLNRNFPSTNWRPDPVTHRWSVDTDSSVALSPGCQPTSEPEVRALMQLVEDLSPACVVSIHSPLGLIDDPDATPLGRLLADRSGLPREVIPNYDTPGSFGSWAKDVGLPSITYELPDATIWDMLPVHLPILTELIEQGPAILER
jgi:protein MpaA